MLKNDEPLLNMPYKFLVSLIILAAVAAPRLRAQLKPLLKPGERPVTCKMENARLADFFNAVWQQTRLQAFYNDEQISSDERVTVNFRNEPLDNVLALLLRKRGLTWYYREETFVILPKKPGDPDLGKLPDEITINVKGIVTDVHGEPLQNATVMAKGARRGISTDKSGKFVLSDIRKKSALTISCIGFKPREIQAPENDHPVSVALDELVTGLDEVVVIAYGTSSRRHLTGSISKVTGEEIAKQPVSDPLLALQGRTPGLFITQTSGLPGAEVKVELRGRNSIDAGNTPMYIVDGVPFPGTALTLNNVLGGTSMSPLGASNPLNMINIADIESIEVLKDADATAIYGSRGSNGVILITTKTGKPGKTKMDVNVYTGIGRVAHNVQYLNTQQYLEMRREAFKNDNALPHDFDNDLLTWDSTSYTDWQKVLLGGTAHITDGQVAFSGGSANMQARISGGYRRETTAYPGNFDYQKAAGRINLALSTPDKRGKVAVAASYVGDKNYLPSIDMAKYVTTAPNAPAVYTAEGSLNWENGTFYNPIANLLRYYKGNTTNLMTNATLSYEVFPGLQIKTNIGYNSMQMDEVQPNPSRSQNPVNGVYPGVSLFANGSSKSWIAEPQVNYLGRLGKGQLTALLGTTFQQEIRKQEGVIAAGYTNDALLENKAAAARFSPYGTGAYYQYRYNALFGRINFNWGGKYIINLTGRRDGSSRFGPGKQFATFGAIGAAWVFSRERWSRNIFPFLSFGKVRASYGNTGNDQIADYGYLTTYSSSPSSTYQGLGGLWPNRLNNPGYGWELNKKLEAGLELGFVQDQVLFRGAYYRNRSSNQLVNYALSALGGFNAIQSNFPALVQNTGIEIELNAVNIKRDQFNWSSAFNISIPNNELLAFPGLESSTYNRFYTIGQPLNVLKGFHYRGVDPETGIYRFEDVNKDGQISYYQDYTAIKRIGALFYGGLQNSLQYKGWQLDIMLQFVKQNRYSYLSGPTSPGANMENQPSAVLERWQANGDQPDIQRFTQNIGDASLAFFLKGQSDAAIADASFIRLKNISLAYLVPAKWMKHIRLQSARFYLQGQNLFTITGYKGRDPEVASNVDVYPPLRVLTVGLQLAL